MQQTEEWKSFSELLTPAKPPEPYSNVIVITKKFRCLGYLDGPDGQWVSVTTRKKIPDVMGWEPV